MSQLQHKLLVSMTNTKSDQRPSLDEVLQHCNSHFESPHHAREEVDKLVSYVLGSSHDVCYTIRKIYYLYFEPNRYQWRMMGVGVGGGGGGVGARELVELGLCS